MDIKEFIKQRNEALLSLDKEKILAVSKASGPSVLPPEDEKVFWAGVHYARLGVVDFSEEVKQESRAWLKNNGFWMSGFVSDTN